MILLTTSLLWLPTLVWLSSSHRQVLGATGHLLVISTLGIQISAVVIGFLVVGVMRTWQGSVAHRAVRVWGWLALVPGVAFVYLLAASMLKGVLEPTAVLVVGLVLILVPAVIPPRRPASLAIVTALYSLLSIGVAAIATVLTVSPILIAPVTAYTVALTLNSTAALAAD